MTVLGKPPSGFLPRSVALWVAAFYVGLFIIRPWEILIPQLGAIHFERWVAIFMILCVITTCGFRFRWEVQNLAVVTFMVMIALTTLAAWNVSTAWDASYVFLTQAVCYFVLVSVIRSPYDLLFIVGAYIGFMDIYLGKALWEYFINGRHVYAQGVTRLVGIEYSFGNHNALAGSIVISLPVWLFLWRNRTQILAQWPAFWQRVIRYGLATYPCLGVLCVVLTNSRMGMLNLCVFVMLWSMQGRSKVRIFGGALLMLAIVGIAWFVLPKEQQDRMRTIWDPTINASADLSTEGRVVAFHTAMEIFRRFPLVGVGPGNFMPYRQQCVDGIHLAPHNLFGQMLAETGLFGAGAFLFLIGATLINGRRVRRCSAGCADSTLSLLGSLTLACRNSMLLIFVEGVATHNFYRFNWLWLGAFCSLAAQFAPAIRARSVVGDDDCEDESVG